MEVKCSIETDRNEAADCGFIFNWLGLPASRVVLPLMEVATRIPAFARRPFQVVGGVFPATVNPHYEVIVRLPTEEEPFEVPLGVVTQSYQLVEHLELLQRAANLLACTGIDLGRVEATLDLTLNAERMRLLLQCPMDSEYCFTICPGDKMVLSLEFVNSVDASLRLSLRVSWVRLKCKNGLMVKEVASDISKVHVGYDMFQECEEHVGLAIQDVPKHKELFKRWQTQPVRLEAFEKWIEATVRPRWGLKAAVRAYHIALRGIDVWITKMARSLPVSKIETKDRASVIGARTTEEALNVFSVAQALTWLAGDRTEFQDELAWKSQVYQMIEPLPGAKTPGKGSIF